MKNLKAVLASVVVGVIALTFVTEAGVRLAGLVDQPLFDANSTIGYIPSADQKGIFLNRNDWVINDKHMGADTFFPGDEGNVLLVGDSIVWGGNPYTREERLGTQLQSLMGSVKVWPIAAGSWGLQNEMTYLKLFPEVVDRIDTIVFVINSGDLDGPSSWGCTLTHPREKPMSAAWFIARKYVFHSPCEGIPPDMAVKKIPPLPTLQEFLKTHPNKRVIFVLYPDIKQTADPRLRNSQLETMKPQLAAVGVQEIVSVGEDPRWIAAAPFYKDAIHPTPLGMSILAKIIAERLQLGMPR